MAREYINGSEREYRIPHNRYEDGKLVGQYYKYYKDNEDSKFVYIHPEVLVANISGKGTASGDYTRREKPHVLECEELGFDGPGEKLPRIKSYHLEYDGDDFKLTFKVAEGPDIVITSEDGKEMELVK